ncbi:MAG TPA: cupin domain-containing protein [Candidatus Polarisedimenticolaceae bacterium]|nr:cupin domain-containing protein [Candidatus Polarisedimenticolaceae bacterium]
MSTSARGPFDPSRTYVQLLDGGGAVTIDVTPDFWRTTVNRHADGRLAFTHHLDRDSPTWERHPEGEELVYLLSGAIDFVLERPDGDEIVRLRAGLAYLVPRGVWHRQVVRSPGDILFVTAGRGTEHRPV